MAADPLAPFSAPTRAWFAAAFAAPTPPQARGWPAIASGDHTLIVAPTGTGKTLAAFLWALDRLTATDADTGAAGEAGCIAAPAAARPPGSRVVYISPLRALATDVEKNLRAPLEGIALAAERLGATVRPPTVGVRTGDTPADERRRLARRPPDILITTPESLFLMLTSRARETLAAVEHVIVDEIHAVAGAKRGAHLMLSLERLEELCPRPPQRIALSATQRPLSEIARFLGGRAPAGDGSLAHRPVTVIDAGTAKEMDVEVVVPIEDMGDLGATGPDPAADRAAEPASAEPERRSIWPSIHPRLLDLVTSHRSTLIFANARRLAERLASRLNELHLGREEDDPDPGETGPGQTGARPDSDPDETRPDETRPDEPAPDDSQPTELVKTHHGSLSRSSRLVVEDELKQGRLAGLVATSSLELGIDMGAVDLVAQVGSPGSVASALQRIGRAGHRVGEPSRGKIFPKHRADLLEAAAVVDLMKQGQVEATSYPRNPLDVLAQQIVAMCAMDDWAVDDLAAVVRRCACFADLSDEVLRATLEMLSGTYPAEEFAGLVPRIVWDRAAGSVRGRAGAQRLAVTNAGTIPDRGLFGVFLPDGTRVGELDEEMVYESRVGETFLLGASAWRITDITFDRVVVVPAPGSPGKMPFWHGEGPGRAVELGQAVGRLVRELRSDPDPIPRLRRRHGLDELAAANLIAYLGEQAEATGAVPDDRTVVVERFPDEIGDWRVCVLTPFGARVHAPWGLALQARLGRQWGVDVDMMWGDDGIALRLPEAVDELPLEEVLFDPDEIAELVVEHLPGTAVFSSRFRECAARALLLPRRRPGQRTPLWQQRRRSADLLAVASKYPSFPILLETARECANDVFDLPALVQLMSDLRSRRIRVAAAETATASPFARSLLFSWIAVYMYEGDAPLAERRAAALTLDRELLRDLLGAEELRELIDPEALADLELELQRLDGSRPARDPDELHDLLRVLGPLSLGELRARSAAGADVAGWVRGLVEQRRAVEVRVAEREVAADSADAARLRDAAGTALPVGLPAACTEPVADPLGDLCLRYARTHGPFLAADPARWLGVAEARTAAALARLAADGRLVRGELRPGGSEREFCDAEVLRRLRRRSVAALRREVEPVEPEALARFLPAWQGVGARRRGADGVAEAVAVLQGAPLAASVLERDVLAARVVGYRPSDLDELCASGEVVWVGAGPLGAADGRVRLVFRDQAGALAPAPAGESACAELVHDALRDCLDRRGASFWGDLVAAAGTAGLRYDDASVLAGLWDLVWAGEVTNDSLAPVRALVSGAGRARSPRRVPSRRGPGHLRGAGRVGRGRPRVGGPTAAGPPTAAGRWSLVAPLRSADLSDTEAGLARAVQLLDRYGVVTREAARAEGQPGGFAGVYPVLKALEERGEVRRGYFVAGLGAAQFALPGAVDRLRAARSDESGPGPPAVMALAATDPAQPYGSVLAWPASEGRPVRAAGAHVVLIDGRPAVELERGGRSLVTFPAAEDPAWIEALIGLAKDGRVPRLEIARANGRPINETPWADPLTAAGLKPGYKGLTWRG